MDTYDREVVLDFGIILFGPIAQQVERRVEATVASVQFGSVTPYKICERVHFSVL